MKVIQYVRRLVTLLLPIAVCFSAYGQNWPLPSKTPRTTVPCVGCSNLVPDGLTVGYEPGITFTGRYLDSNNTSDYQGTFRTARAASVYVDNPHNRVYMRIGSAIFAYNKDTFFQRLEAGEALMPSTQFPVQPANARLGAPEVFLKFDEYFYPEYNSSGWKTVRQDGQDRILGFDVDDAGYVYVAASIYGWGIVQDNLTTGTYNIMPTLFQRFPQPGDPSPVRIVAAKSTTGNRHYAFVSAGGVGVAVWDVTSRKNPQFMTKLSTGIQWFAKSGDQTLVALVDYSGVLGIYAADAFANGGSPLYTEQGVRGVTTDGTNFFTTKLSPSGLSIVVLSPNGPTYSRREMPAGGTFQIVNIQQSEGFIVLSGLDAGSGWDTQVFKLSPSLVPSPITVNSYPAGSTYKDYYRSYYSAPPTIAGSMFLNPGTININDGSVARTAAGKTYLIISGYGIGDVYELPGSAGVSITATNFGSLNPNTPPDRNTNTYYSDPLQFIGSTTDTTVGQLLWNFGNPESGPTANSGQTAPPSPITFQYANLTASTLGPKTVTATAMSNPAVKGTTTVNLTLPQIRIKIPGTSYLFMQPNASSPAPIITGDTWVDASDGRVESHYDTWTLDTVQTKALPSPDSLPVGGCGNHTLGFQALYGPYSGAGASLTSSFAPLPLGLNGTISYSVRPFAASVDLASTDASSLTFRSSSRVNNSVVNLSYKYELLMPDGSLAAVPSPLGPYSGNPTTNGSTFVVPKINLTSRGMRVRLTLKSTDVFTGCTGLDPNTSIAYSQYLNGPDPLPIVQTGLCDNGGPCSFTVTSATPNLDTVADGWTYQWQVLNGSMVDATAVSAASFTNKIFNPTFVKAGTFTVQLTVKNAIGSATLNSSAVVITKPASLCSKMTAATWNVAYQNGTSSNCSTGIPCIANETISFVAGSLLGYNGGYDPGCSDHTLSWTFGDGGTAGPILVPKGSTFTNYGAPHAYLTNGTYTVRLTVTNTAGDSGQASGTIQIGSTAPPPPPPPPPPSTDPCASLGPSSVNTTYAAAAGGSGCSSSNSTPCNPNETLTFAAAYSGTCANTYTWDFGDGSGSVSTKTASHQYANTGTFNVMLKVQNPQMGTPLYKPMYVTVGSTASGCGQITPNVSLWIDFHNGSNTCGPLTPGGCVSNDALTFSVKDYMPYNISCATHTYDWDFGDGSAHANTNTVNHTYAASGTFTAKCIVSNGPQTVTLSQAVVIGGQSTPNPAKPDVTLDFTAVALTQTPGAYVYLFTPTATPAGIVTRYVWTYGDGKTDAVVAPGIASHLYPDNTRRVVTVTAYDAVGNSWTHNAEVPMTAPRRRVVRH